MSCIRHPAPFKFEAALSNANDDTNKIPPAPRRLEEAIAKTAAKYQGALTRLMAWAKPRPGFKESLSSGF